MEVSPVSRFFLAGQQSSLTEKQKKLSSEHVSGGGQARRAGILFEKIKTSADSGIWLALAWNFFQFSDFLARQ
jgi:hypothetical protein